MVQIIKTARGGITTYHGEDAGRTFPHVGIDVGHGNMTDDDRRMVAPAAGRVTAAGWSGTYGNRVIITHDDGTWSLIAHMDSLNVSVGDYVQQGQQIGVMGRTGGPWGSIAGWFVHGHQEYHLANGTAVNPLDYRAATAGGETITPITPIAQEDDDMKPYIISDGAAFYLCVPGRKMIHIPDPKTLTAIRKMLAGESVGNLSDVQAIERVWIQIPV